MFHEKVMQRLASGQTGDFTAFVNAQAPSTEARTKAYECYILDGFVRSRKGMDITTEAKDNAMNALGRALDELAYL